MEIKREQFDISYLSGGHKTAQKMINEVVHRREMEYKKLYPDKQVDIIFEKCFTLQEKRYPDGLICTTYSPYFTIIVSDFCV